MAELDVSATHERHDRSAIAEAADRGGPGRLARALVAACGDCARLYRDLQALALALPATATPTRPRDFSLTAADAERLRSRSLRHWLGRIGSARDTVTRPLAVGLTTLGLAGLLVATVPAFQLGTASGPAPAAASQTPAAAEGAGGAAPEAPAAAATSGTTLQMSADPEATKVDDGGVFSGTDQGDPAPATPGEAAQRDAVQAEEPATAADGFGAALPVMAGLLTVAGLGLFALRWSARRFGTP